MKPVEAIYLPHNELCSVNLILPIGQAHDPYGKIGLTHLIEHLFFHAHPKFSQEEMMIKIEEMGGIFNAITDREMTIIYGKIPKDYVNEVIILFKDALMNLKNSLNYLDVERKIILRELQTVGFKPYHRMSDIHHQILFESEAFQKNQYIQHDLNMINSGDVLDFIEYYDWKYWKLLVVGGFDIKNLDSSIAFKGKIPSVSQLSLKPIHDTTVYKREGKHAGVTISVLLPEYFKDLESIILTNILLKGIASPFYFGIIKENGIAYNIEVTVNKYLNLRYLEFGWTCHKDDVVKSDKILNELFQKITNNEFDVEGALHSGLQKTKTEILLIQENFIRYSSHLTKQIALTTYLDDTLDIELQKASKNIVQYAKQLFEQPKLIGFHI